MKPSKGLNEQIDKIFYNPDHTKTYNPSGKPTGVVMTDFDIMEAKQQLLALTKQREHEAKIDELKRIDKANKDNGITFWFKDAQDKGLNNGWRTMRQYVPERITELSQTLKEYKKQELENYDHR